MTIDLKSLGTSVGACVAIFTGVWFFASPALEKHMNELIKQHVEDRAFKRDQADAAKKAADDVFKEFLKSREFEKKLDDFLEETNSNSVSLRHLLSIKMNMPEEDVADAIADMYNKDKKRLINVLRLINNEYPEARIWEID